jgi:putative phosphoesterase
MIAIISDIHDNLANLDKFLKYAKDNKISEIICLGDLTSDSTLERLAKGFNGNIHLVLGNADFFDVGRINFGQVKYYGKKGSCKIGDKMVAFTHFLYEAKNLADSEKYDYVFYGHTHKPWEEKRGNTVLINPGTVSGMLSKASFAVWNLKENKFALILLDEL